MTTILAYGDSNTWGARPMPPGATAERFPHGQRWPVVMAKALGEEVTVIAEGLNGRTTCVDDPVEGRHKNGETHLLACLESHMPLDLVIIMLGTNDLKARFGLPPSDIAAGAGRLVRLAQQSGCGPGGAAPHVLLACPAPVVTLTRFAEMFEGAREKSLRLALSYREVAASLGAAFVDVGSHIVSSEIDGIHLDAGEQVKLGEGMALVVREVLGMA
jgi:lysophospholipase L1-like esterase